tara:strand:- start:118 stop:468 length:351 start_codon:yes stop_codon:yes gene_type:complete
MIMSLRDTITGGEIYTPHIRIYPIQDRENYMGPLSTNATTFGDYGQENLIFPKEVALNPERILDLHRVTAVVVEQSPIGHQRPQASGQVISETLLGYLERETFVSLIEEIKEKQQS